MLRRIRMIAGALCFALLTLLFLDFTGTLHRWLGFLAKIQFMPALMTLNVGIVAGLLLLTFMFGRVYCSVICPLGVLQDIVSGIASRWNRRRFRWSPAVSWLRYSVLALFVIAIVCGAGSAVALLSPYSAYGRVAGNLFAPLWQWGNNLLAMMAERTESYAFYPVKVWLPSVAALTVALLTFAAIVAFSWRSGRTYCNTVCPVGTFLGVIARVAIFKPVIDVEKCNGCKFCARNCKASCIDSEQHAIDYSRCVVCLDCIGKCKQGAIRYAPQLPFVNRFKTTGDNVLAAEMQAGGVSRRHFFSLGALLVAPPFAKAQQKLIADGGLADIADKQRPPERTTPVIPPGSLGARNMARHCTGCSLCVTVCPSKILRPAGGLMTLLQPELSFEHGYCRPECVKCGEVCPTGAIQPLTTADKSATKVGRSVFIKERCVNNTDKQPCDNCARHCPTQAITMAPNPDAPQEAQRPPGGGFFFGPPPKPLMIPVIDDEKCIGCGACEHLCPSRPLSAIYVEGNLMHRIV
ncbi:MAG: 4Fe-4S binding protein [Tannerella sp.]|jgi:ferredoxin|nr:4Fe-4S binding protein [Tannerella sp.]